MWVELDSRVARESPAPTFSLDFGVLRPFASLLQSGGVRIVLPSSGCPTIPGGLGLPMPHQSPGLISSYFAGEDNSTKNVPPLQNQPVY